MWARLAVPTPYSLIEPINNQKWLWRGPIISRSGVEIPWFKISPTIYRKHILDRKDELKIKHDKLSMFGENQGKYVTPTRAVCLTSTKKAEQIH